MSGSPVGVAIVGAGVISTEYLDNLMWFPDVQVLGIADLDRERAREKADQYGIDVSGDLDTVLAVDDVEIVVNLTIPAAHAAVASAALGAGKHVYSEKPLATDHVDGEKLLNEAAEAGLWIGCAPDTVLGAGIQSARRVIDGGAIGEPISAMTAVMTGGPEAWHPSPEFVYARGGGPVFDLGPYYLTSLVTFLGPIRRVASLARQVRTHRVIGSGPKRGTTFPVEVPTHVTALLDFAEGASAVSTFSFDSAHRRVLFEVTGTEGTLAVPNPNKFDGALCVKTRGEQDWRELPVDGYSGGRGVGVLDLARAIRSGTPPRAAGDLAKHVLELMMAIAGADEFDDFLVITSTTARPEPLPLGWDAHSATL